MIGESRVLTHAIVLKPLANGGHTETVTLQGRDVDGDPVDIEDTVTVIHWAEPGEVIDVSTWADVQAYVNQGMIQLLTTEQVEAYEAKQKRGPKNDRRPVAAEAEQGAAGTR